MQSKAWLVVPTTPTKRLLQVVCLFMSMVAFGCSDDSGSREVPLPASETAVPQAQASPVATFGTGFTPQLLSALRGGGYVILFRHALTDRSQADDLPAILNAGNENDCSIQRNLNQDGREQSRRIGEAISRLSIPTGVVVSSPYCRTRETAELAFGRYEVNDALSLTPIVDRDTASAGADAMRSFLLTALTARVPGTNTIVVSHGANFVAVGLPDIAEGDSLILQTAGGSWRLVGQVIASDWQTLR